jgi:hypothetical protein
VLGQVPPRTTPRSMPRPHICAACDPPAFRPSPTAGLMSTFGASVYHRLRKAQPCSLREWDGRTWKKLERAKGFEPSTPTLARSCSTPELHPHPNSVDQRPPEHPATYAKRCPPLQPPPGRRFGRGAGPLVVSGGAVHETRAGTLVRDRISARRDFALSTCLVA